MSNGNKKVVFNSRERVISTDFNRLQEMVAGERSRLMKRWVNGPTFLEHPGHSGQNNGTASGGTPLLLDVYGGLFVEVDDPSSITITDGVVGVVQNDSPLGADDVDYKLLNEPGLSTTGILTFTANAGPGLRVDVVECAMTSVVLETESRDIFDPSTGLFTPASVNKVVQHRLTYRVRTGTQGGGYPGHAQGWCPLVVAIVPSTATGWDGCHFYDVRPMVNERYLQASSKRHPVIQSNVVLDERVSPTDATKRLAFRGTMLTTFDGYLAGGKISKGTAGFGSGQETFENQDVEWVDALDADNRATAWGNAFEAWVYLVALFPEGLPRWARYSVDAINAKRRPYGPRGILCMVRGLAAGTDGTIGNDRHVTDGVLPTNSGLTGTADGVVLAGTYGDDATANESVLHMVQHGNTVYLRTDTGNPLALTLESSPPTNSQWVDLSAARTAHQIPPYAKVAEAQILLTLGVTTPFEDELTISVRVGIAASVSKLWSRSYGGTQRLESVSAPSFYMPAPVKVPMFVDEESDVIAANDPLLCTVFSANAALTSMGFAVVGFEF